MSGKSVNYTSGLIKLPSSSCSDTVIVVGHRTDPIKAILEWFLTFWDIVR